jgi:hypothetical protein
MTTSFHTKIAGTIAAALVIVAVSAPTAVGAAGGSHAKPQHSINYSEPGSTGYVSKSQFSLPYTEPGSTGYVPQRFSLNYTEPGSTGFVPVAAVTSVASGSGFDWTSALIGAGAALGIAVACAGGLAVLRRRRGLAHA